MLRASAPRIFRATSAIVPGSSAAGRLSLPIRAASTYLDAHTKGGEGQKRQRNFWQKWGDLSQQSFWQDVGFAHDRVSEERRAGLAMLKNPKKKKAAPSGGDKEFKDLSERNTASGLTTEEYFDAEDAFGLAQNEGVLRPDGSAMPAGAYSLEELDRMYGGLDGGLDVDEEEMRPFALGQGYDASRVGTRMRSGSILLRYR